MFVHEVFVHPFRLPRRGEEWHISCFAMLLHSKKPGWSLPYAGSAIRDAFCKKRNNP